MPNKSKWYLILVIGLVLLLATSVVGCGSIIDEEAIEYLSEMREWQDKWGEKWIRE